MTPNLPAAQQIPWYMQGVTPAPVQTMPVQGSPQMGMPRLPYMQFAPPQMQPQMQPMPQQNIQPVPRPMPQPGGMFAPPPAAAAAQPARGLFGGRFDNIGQRINDVMRENPMAWSAVASGLMDKGKNDNVTFSEITGNAIRAGEYDTENKEKREERAKEGKRESVTRKWVMGMGFSEDDADAAMAEPAILNYLIQQRQGRDPTALMDEYEWAKQGGYEGSPIEFLREKSGSSNKPPSAVQEYQFAKAEGFPGTFQDWEASKKGGMSLQVDPETGQVTFQHGGNIKPLTEGQSKDTVYATRAEGSLKTLNEHEGALASLPQDIARRTPVVGNYLVTEEYQMAKQAGKEFLQAVLRKDTGATITPQEMTEYGGTYLPEPGDGPEVLEQKKAARSRALEAMKAGMTPQAILAQEKALRAGGGGALPEGVTEEDILHTMQTHGLTREQVLERLGQ
jgi:hypothetical protein